jgi:hypothetical protein
VQFSTFAHGREISFGVPPISVQSIGEITYPLSVPQTAALRNVATQAPFGKGTETVVDPEVRRAWQIDSDLVAVNAQWTLTVLPKIVAECCAKLGIDAVKWKVSAHFYKMLLYEEGGHFKKHRDTEKEPGMFGSLLIQLPAEHTGGHLVVEHMGESKRFAFDKDSADNAYFTSFYADCEHVLEPVTSGFRLVLAFNLVRGVSPNASSIRAAAAIASNHCSVVHSLLTATQAWCADSNGVEKFAVPLEHKYSHANASFDGLKGNDLKTAEFLRNAKDPHTHKPLFSVFLALVTKHVNSPECEEYCEIDMDFETTAWVGPQGPISANGLQINFGSEVITAQGKDQDEACKDMFGKKADRKEKQGYQGNFPGEIEYWYHSAVLVFWPTSKDFGIKLQWNPRAVIDLLEEMNAGSDEFTENFEVFLQYMERTKGDLSLNRVLALTHTLSQVKRVLKLSKDSWFGEQGLDAVMSQIRTYGLDALASDVAALVQSKSLRTALILLQKVDEMRAKSGPDTSVEVNDTTDSVWWSSVVQLLVRKVLAVTTEQDSTLLVAVKFIVKHCNLTDQIAIASYLGTACGLTALNSLILQLQPQKQEQEQNNVYAAVVNLFKSSVVQLILQQKTKSVAGVGRTLQWVISGQHVDILLELTPLLLSWCSRPTGTYRYLMSLPAVTDALKETSPIGLQLEGLVQARVAYLESKVAPSKLNWCMPELKCPSFERVTQFLACHLQQFEFTFSGITEARYFAKVVTNTVDGVTAVASGTRSKSIVVVTKKEEALVKLKETYATELATLRLILEERNGPPSIGALQSVVIGAGNDCIRDTDTLKAEDADLPLAKKAKTEVNVIV